MAYRSVSSHEHTCLHSQTLQPVCRLRRASRTRVVPAALSPRERMQQDRARQGDNRIIMPGQGNQQRSGEGQLIIPGQGGKGAGNGRSGNVGNVGGGLVGGMPSVTNFRPPPGFMDKDSKPGQDDSQTDSVDAAELLRRINSGSGTASWKLLPEIGTKASLLYRLLAAVLSTYRKRLGCCARELLVVLSTASPVAAQS